MRQLIVIILLVFAVHLYDEFLDGVRGNKPEKEEDETAYIRKF